MNNGKREDRHFNDAAEQARTEGVSSFGIGANAWSAAQIARYTVAADRRGMTFVIDDDTALFVDDSCLDQFEPKE